MYSSREVPLVLKRTLPLLGAVVLLLMLGSCSRPDREKARTPAPLGSVLVKGAGATFPSLLYKQWFATYQTDHPKAVITYDSVGSGEGIRRFTGKNIKTEEDKVDFGASDAAMNDQEIDQVPGGVVMVPVTAGSVVLAYNLPDFQGDLKLSRKAYAGIFLGEVKNWNDPLIAKTNPNTKLPNLTIAAVVRQDKSGTTYAFTNHLAAISEKWRGQHSPATLIEWPGLVMRAPGNEGVAGLIQHSIGSIGYVGYEFARKLGLRMALLENKQGNFVRPTEQSCKAALAEAQLPEDLRLFIPDPVGRDSYPIVTLSWILLHKRYEAPEKVETIRNLFGWCLLNGQNEAPKLNYIPLPSNVVTKALSALGSITVLGNGKSAER
jgi:phosphate transport system substrate-binding protein